MQYGGLDPACEADPSLPSPRSARLWASLYPEFSQALAQARKEAAHTHAESGFRELQAVASQDAPDRGKVRAVGQLANYRLALAGAWNRAVYGQNQPVQAVVNVGLQFASFLPETAQGTPVARLEASDAQALEAASQASSPPLPSGGESGSPPRMGAKSETSGSPARMGADFETSGPAEGEGEEVVP